MAATNELKTELEGTKKLEVTANISGQSTLQQLDSVDRKADGRFNLGASYPLSKRIRGAVSITAIQGLDDARKSTLGNAKVSFSHSAIPLSNDSTFLMSGGVRLPTNVEDRKINSYNGSVDISPLLLTQWAPRGFTFTTIYNLDILKNSHYWDRTSMGEANISYSATNYLGFEKYVSQHVSILIDGDYTYAHTYQESLRTLFTLGQSVTYEEPKWSVTIGHSNNADALMANGTDYNIHVFDQNTSLVYISTRIVY